LLFVGHVPLVDGSLSGFLAALEEVKTLRANLVIPGPGRALAWAEVMAAEERYLTRHLDDVRAAIKAKRTLAERLGSVDEDASNGFCSIRFTSVTLVPPMPSSSGTSKRRSVYCLH